MKYRFSNSEKTIKYEGRKEQTYMVCDKCGKLCKTNYGYEISASFGGGAFDARVGLCGECAKKIVPKIYDTLVELGEFPSREAFSK